jgi:pilus assembly protein FimV
MKNRLIAVAGAMVLMTAALPAQALTIGDIEVKSAYGERFDARIPLLLQAGEDIVQGCVRLDTASTANSGVPTLVNYTLSLEPVKAGKSAVRVSTNGALTEPAVRINLVIRCGQKTSSAREFVINQKLGEARK